MERPHYLAVAGAALGLAYLVWRLWPAPLTVSQQRARAAFTRPTEVATEHANQFTIFVNDIDWVHDVPELVCGKTYPMRGKFEQQVFGGPGRSGGLFIVPRLESQGDEGFSWLDLGTDRAIGTARNARDGIHIDDSLEKVPWAPGKYRVRFYLGIHPHEFNQPNLPEYVLLGESSVVVLPSPDGIQGMVPLASSKHKMRLRIKPGK